MNEVDTIFSTEFTIENAHILCVLDSNFFASNPTFTNFQHYHSKYEIFLVKQGECIIGIEKEILHLRENSFIIIPAGVRHNIISAQNALVYPMKLQFYKNTKLPDKVNYDVFTLLDSLAQNNKIRIFSGCVRIFIKFEELITIARTKSFLYQEYFNAAVKQFMIDMIIFIHKPKAGIFTEDKKSADFELKNKSRKVYTDIIENYIGNFYDREVSLHELSELLSLSHSHIRRLFNHIYGMNFIEKVTHTRIEAAKKIIIENNLPLTDVAGHVGYNSYNGFCRAFRKLTGKTPAEYKKINKIQHY